MQTKESKKASISFGFAAFISAIGFVALNYLMPFIYAAVFSFATNTKKTKFTFNTDGSSEIFFALLAVVLMISCVAALYAVGSVFEKRVESRQESGKTKVIFSTDEIVFTKGLAVDEKSWNCISKVKEDIDNFYFKIEERDTFEIAKILFRRETQIQEFKKLLRSNLGDKAMLKK